MWTLTCLGGSVASSGLSVVQLSSANQLGDSAQETPDLPASGLRANSLSHLSPSPPAPENFIKNQAGLWSPCSRSVFRKDHRPCSKCIMFSRREGEGVKFCPLQSPGLETLSRKEESAGWRRVQMRCGRCLQRLARCPVIVQAFIHLFIHPLMYVYSLDCLISKQEFPEHLLCAGH